MAAIIRRVRQAVKPPKVAPAVTPIELSSEEVEAVLDKRAKAALGMSGDEFLSRLERGDLPDNAAVDELAVLVGGRS